MKQARLVIFGYAFLIAFAVLTWGADLALAQFNNKPSGGNPSGTTGTGATTNSATGGVVTPRNHGVTTLRKGEYQNATLVDTGVWEGTKLDYMDFEEAEVWGRALIHSDGSYTETKQADDGQTMTQKTKSANGVLLQERIIMADSRGKPSEVLIKDASGQFRYRGVLLYDHGGRFTEEQLFDMNSQLLRRRIQEYGPGGEPKLRVFDYVKNLPPDIRLIITKELDAEQAERNLREFQQAAKEREKVEERAAAVKPEEPKKKKGFFGLFGGKDD